ncbi:MAG: hypothetical protein QOJ15_7703, partial [Bradyrhizobium sp.]|nr:hypothetical protein [Bradyrhizobium sp.]
DGFAVKFVEQQRRNDLNRLIIRPAPLPSADAAKAAPRVDDARLVRVAT